MSYQEFINTLTLPIQYFINWLIQIANNLINNYIFITLLGITLFISFVWFIFNLVFNYIDSINNRYDDYNDKYYNYELSKEVQSDYLNNHYSDEFDYRYRSKVLNGQVLNAYLSNNKELDVDNKRLANLNKIDALKDIKNDKLSDNDDSNDSDIDLIIPPKPQLTNWNELKQAQLKEFREEIKNEVNNEISRIEKENPDLVDKLDYYNINGVKIPMSIWKNHEFNTDNFGYINGHLTDLRTGEVYEGSCPIPPGSVSLSKMTKEELDEINRFNELQQAKLDSGNWRNFHSKKEYSNIDEDLDAQLFL